MQKLGNIVFLILDPLGKVGPAGRHNKITYTLIVKCSFVYATGCDVKKSRVHLLFNRKILSEKGYDIIAVARREEKLKRLKEELKKVKEQLDISNLRVKAFCRFIVPYIEKTIPNVNDVVNMYPSMHKGSCCFVGQSGNSFYPLNVVLELEEKNMINKLIELGAYKLAEGSFKDLRNPDKYQTKHSLDRLFRYCCDDAHYNMLKKNFKENSEWNETLEKLFPNK